MSSKRSKTISLSTLIWLAFAGAAAAESMLVCCKYTYTWSTKDGDQGPDGPCSGVVANLCEETATTAGNTDPLRQLASSSTRWANCYRFDLGAFNSFVRGPCNSPPTNGIFVGVRPDGTCCWIVGTSVPTQTTTPRSFQVTICNGPCNNDPPPN